MLRPTRRVLRIRVPEVPRAPDDPAHELAVNPLGPLAGTTTEAADKPARHRVRPRPTTETVRRPRIPGLHRRRLRSILAPLRTESLVLGARLIGSPAAATDPATKRRRPRVPVLPGRRALRAAATAVELIAMKHAEELSASTTGLHRDRWREIVSCQTTSGREISLRGSRPTVPCKKCPEQEDARACDAPGLAHLPSGLALFTTTSANASQATAGRNHQYQR